MCCYSEKTTRDRLPQEDVPTKITLSHERRVVLRRGNSKAKNFLTECVGALDEPEKATKLDSQFAIALYEDGLIAMMVLKDKKNAQVDFEHAAKLGFTVAQDALRQLHRK